MSLSNKASCKRSGFTLIELTVVMALIGIFAVILFPRIGAWRGDESLLLQRSVYEAMDIASKGNPIRLTVNVRGKLTGEVLSADNDGKPVWKIIKLRWLPQRGIWKSESGNFHIFPDGTCTPWNLSVTEKTNRVNYMVSVVGRVYKIEGSPTK